MILSARNLVVGLVVALGATSFVLACGSDDDSKFKDNPPVNPSFGDGGFGEAGDDPNGTLFKDDPFPNFCGIDGGPAAPHVGGTVDCPDDKNKPGCGCDTPSDVPQACWTGLRKNRNLGQCHDGTTKCVKAGENHNVWSECVGQKLPTEGATGAEACSCFSVGLWKIKNTAPCVWTDGQGYYAYSTIIKPDPTDPTNPNKYIAGYCGENNTDPPSPVAPRGTDAPDNWSTDTLTTDCAGSFDLVFRIRVGDYKNPSSNDCILGESTPIHVEYLKPNVEQELPPLPAWHSTDSACAQKWEKDTPEDVSPGYWEMIVKGGETVACEAVSNVPKDQEYIFNRGQYCAKKCRNPANAQDPICVDCQLKGQGQF